MTVADERAAAAVTDDRLDLGAIVAEPRILAVPGQGEFPIRRDLGVPTMRLLLELETEINEAMVDESDAGDERMLQATLRGHAAIMRLVREQTPDAEDLELDTQQVLVTLSWAAGDTSVADAVARALTAGRTAAKTAEDIEAEELERAEGEEEEAGSATPLRSEKPSTGRSSSSGGRTAGSRATGSGRAARRTGSRGASSAGTSSTRSAATT